MLDVRPTCVWLYVAHRLHLSAWRGIGCATRRIAHVLWGGIRVLLSLAFVFVTMGRQEGLCTSLVLTARLVPLAVGEKLDDPGRDPLGGPHVPAEALCFRVIQKRSAIGSEWRMFPRL